MINTELVRILRNRIAKNEEAINAIKRKRSWRLSEKAIATAALVEEKAACGILIRKLQSE